MGSGVSRGSRPWKLSAPKGVDKFESSRYHWFSLRQCGRPAAALERFGEG